ncbi:hypothetical protein QOZ98_001675 [Planomicrobium stackebrandtii]|uniref:Uncharacterized protein n=1 Tax=Planomicrobium stackebrandtii TaxID=253160 RepID=A0ABU0GU73_9BACL|nr:hypothetical protein [Planomicrobium stackebrandtii]MDQ0428848.1 hypothetical protein [Planomicrobium stackebrandtii]
MAGAVRDSAALLKYDPYQAKYDPFKSKYVPLRMKYDPQPSEYDPKAESAVLRFPCFVRPAVVPNSRKKILHISITSEKIIASKKYKFETDIYC